jgi:hypothetical protein
MSVEHDLRLLAEDVFPPEPDLREAVLARIEPRPQRQPRRPLLLLAAVLAAAALAALAVPQARSALERWLGIGSARIERTETLPHATGGPLVSGQRTSAKAAESWIRHRLLYPHALGEPTELRVDWGLSVVALRWAEPGVRLLELESGRIYLQKLVGGNTSVERVTVNGRPGYWIGGRHVAFFDLQQPRWVGPALLWEQDGLTLRLDGPRTQAGALRIARTIG